MNKKIEFVPHLTLENPHGRYKCPIHRVRWLMPAPSETLKSIKHGRGACEKQDLVGSSVSVITRVLL